MLSLLSASAAPVLGLLLAVGGAAKLFGRGTARQAAGTALVRLLGDAGRATSALRAVGAAELLIGAGLLAAPAPLAPGAATAALGAGFLGYLGYSRTAAPESSCGCTARDDSPITWRSFARAGLVLAGGAAAAASGQAWWAEAASHPLAAAGWAIAMAVVLAALSTDLDHLWLLPLRRARLKVFGHPLAGFSGGEDGRERVPVAASVELLERSLAWQSAAPWVRSALLDHWDDGDWRILRFSGVQQGTDSARPVSVLFALDARLSADTSASPAVRVAVVDDRTDEVVPVPLPDSPPRTVLPLVT
jgi:hypothetical protein